MLKVYGLDKQKTIICSKFGYNFKISNYVIPSMEACNLFECTKVTCTINNCFGHRLES